MALIDELTEDELRAAIKAMIDGWAIDNHNASISPMAWQVNDAIEAIHAARKRLPTEWPEVK